MLGRLWRWLAVWRRGSMTRHQLVHRHPLTEVVRELRQRSNAQPMEGVEPHRAGFCPRCEREARNRGQLPGNG